MRLVQTVQRLSSLILRRRQHPHQGGIGAQLSDAQGQAPSPMAGPQKTNRRSLLKIGTVAAAGVAMLATETLASRTAHAGTGSSMVVGQQNEESTTTSLIMGVGLTQPNPSPTFQVDGSFVNEYYNGNLVSVATTDNTVAIKGISGSSSSPGAGAGVFGLAGNGGVGVHAQGGLAGLDAVAEGGGNCGIRIFAWGGHADGYAIPLYIAPSSISTPPTAASNGQFFVSSDGSLYYYKNGWIRLA